MCDFVVFSAMGRVISEQVGAAVRPSGVRGAKSTHWRYYSFDHPGGHEDAAMPKPPCPPRVLAVVAVMRERVPLGWWRDRVRGVEWSDSRY